MNVPPKWDGPRKSKNDTASGEDTGNCVPLSPEMEGKNKGAESISNRGHTGLEGMKFAIVRGLRGASRGANVAQLEHNQGGQPGGGLLPSEPKRQRGLCEGQWHK